MKRQDAIRLARERAGARTPSVRATDRNAPGDDAVRIVTLGQLWGTRALAPGRSATVAASVSSNEIHEVGRLRYELFVERDGRTYAHANHAERVLIEPVDAVSLNLRATSGQNCLAAVRLTQGLDAVSDTGLAATLRRSGHAHDDCLIVSHMAVRPEAAAPALAVDLGRHAYRAGLQTGAGIAVLAARTAQVEWFARFGFKPSGPSWDDASEGEVRCLVLNMLDRAWLEAIDSPLLAELDAFDPSVAGTNSEVSILDLANDL